VGRGEDTGQNKMAGPQGKEKRNEEPGWAGKEGEEEGLIFFFFLFFFFQSLFKQLFKPFLNQTFYTFSQPFSQIIFKDF
jgi:hypothetical protein